MSTKGQSQPKQTTVNHFVSRFTSRPWLLRTNQFYKLWADASGARATPAGPKNWGCEEHLYDQAVENAFEQIESRLASLHKKLETGCQLTDDERYGWAMWLLASYLRTPTAFLRSAEVNATTHMFTGDLFRTSYAMLAACVTNPHCIELITNRDWQILTCDKPYFLKPDCGVVLTDRLDQEDCLILYPLSPFSCFLATGSRRRFSRISVHKKRVFGLNNHILRWSDTSVACTTYMWMHEQFALRDAVRTNLATGQYSPPTSGRFFSMDTLKSDGKMQATILAPRGPMIMSVPEYALRTVNGPERPKIPGLYDMGDCPDVRVEIRYSDDENEVNYAAAARLMMNIGQLDLAVNFARKALQKDKSDLGSKLIILTIEPTADVGGVVPDKPDDAAQLAIWMALAKGEPLEGLKITSAWLAKHLDHEWLMQANFLCAFMVYGAKLFLLLCGIGEKLPYIEDSTPLPDGAVELVERACSHRDGGIVSDVQRHIGKIDLKASGLAADVLKVCGLNNRLTLYRKP